MNDSMLNDVLDLLKSYANIDHFNKLKRFGIKQDRALGIKIPDLRLIAKQIGLNPKLADLLLESQIHEAKILASFIDDPKQLSLDKIYKYIDGFDSWDVCDQSCTLIFKSIYTEKLIADLYTDKQEFRKRTAFVLICCNAVHNKKLSDFHFENYFNLIESQAWDERNFVRKAVNWALRQIGKRNLYLHEKAIECAERISLQNTKSAKWIAADALRELNDPKILMRLQNKELNQKL